jgi:hypothetical protein
MMENERKIEQYKKSLILGVNWQTPKVIGPKVKFEFTRGKTIGFMGPGWALDAAATV